MEASDPLGENTPCDGFENMAWPWEQLTEVGQKLFIGHRSFQVQSVYWMLLHWSCREEMLVRAEGL